MGYDFGSGLPKSLDATRLKNVLGFARSQERVFRAALDSAGSPAWKRTDPEWIGNGQDDDLYARLIALLRSTEGRFAWIRAESVFEGDKKKRMARANIFIRLFETIHDEIERGQYGIPSAPAPGGGWESVIDSVAGILPADRLAELAWALSWPERDADGLVAAVERHPEIRPCLEEVLAGLAPVDDREDNAGSAASVVSLAIGALDVEAVEGDDLEALAESARWLGEIVSKRRAALERPAVLLREWRERQGNKAEEFEKLAALLKPLQRRIDERRIEAEDMESVIGCLDEAIMVEEEIREKRRRLDAAVSGAEYGAVATLGGELEELKERLEGCYDEIHGEAYWPFGDMPVEGEDAPCAPAPVEDFRDIRAEDVRETGEEAPDAAAEAGPSDADERAPDAAAQASAQPEPDVPPPGGDAPDPADNAAADDAEPESAAPDVPEAAADESPPEPAPAADGASADTETGIGAEVAAALAQRRFGLAWHLARAEPGCAPGADAAKLAASVYAGDSADFAASGLSALLDALDRDAQAAPEDAAANAADCVALVASAALTHGLSPAAGPSVARLLSTLMPRLAAMPAFHALAATAAAVATSGVSLPRELLRGGGPASGWRDELAALRDETRQWRERERHARLNFQAATQVWKRAMADWEEDGRKVSLGRMIDMLLKNEAGVDRTRIADIARWWRRHGEEEVHRIDREQRSRAATAPIEGTALNDLLGRIAEAANIADRWIDLIERRPAPESFDRKQADLLRDATREHAEEAAREVSELESPLAPVAGDLVRRYASMFDPAAPEPGAAPGLSDLLNGDLLANPDIDFDERGRPATEPVELRHLRPLLGEARLDFATAALRRAERGDFRNAGAAVEFARTTGRIGDAGGVQAGIHRLRVEAGDRMRERIGETRARVESAFARGLVSDDEFEALHSEIPADDPPPMDSYRSCMDALEAIGDEIDEREEKTRNAPRATVTKAQEPRPMRAAG